MKRVIALSALGTSLMAAATSDPAQQGGQQGGPEAAHLPANQTFLVACSRSFCLAVSCS